jgi:multidrug efflux pump subunit AcrA (membrane-fusion protein)
MNSGWLAMVSTLGLVPSCIDGLGAIPESAYTSTNVVVSEMAVARSEEQGLLTLTGVLVPRRRGRIPALETGILRAGGLGVGDRIAQGMAMFRVERVGLEEELVQRRLEVTTVHRQVDRAQEVSRFAQDHASVSEDLATWLSKQDVRRAHHERALATTDLRIALAELAEAEMRHESVVRQQERATILAPFEGRITQMGFEDGEWVEQGATLAWLESTESLRIRTAVSETDRRCIVPGSAVSWWLVDRPRSTHATATVVSVAPKVDGTSGLLMVELEPNQLPGDGIAGAEVVLEARCP